MAMVSDLANVGGLEAFGALDYLELHIVSLGQRSETFGDDGGVVHEHVLPTLLRDEPESLRIIEPLDRALRHCRNLLKGSPRAPGKHPALVAGRKRPKKKPPGPRVRPADTDSTMQGRDRAVHAIRSCAERDLSIRRDSAEYHAGGPQLMVQEPSL